MVASLVPGVTPAVRASTTKRARKNEVFDKMTTVRGIGGTEDGADILKSAIAATLTPAMTAKGDLQKLKDKIGSNERGNSSRFGKTGGGR